MTVLIACLGEGKGTWGAVFKLAQQDCWEKVYFVGPRFAQEKVKLPPNSSFIVVDNELSMKDAVGILCKNLDGKVFGEVAVNLFSGNGFLHTAVIAGLLKLGAGIRLVFWSDKDLVEEA